LRGILEALRGIAKDMPVIFPAHPRTVKVMRENDLGSLVDLSGGPASTGAVSCIEPVGYVDFLALMAEARIVLTDSGGIQEETTILAVPCLTLRENTERPITLSMGSNRLVGSDPDAIAAAAAEALELPRLEPVRPPLWDGKAGERIADAVVAWGASR
jgi:UDP-N-acetylglucosamine 2-epimerase (non-hydrolysing)